MIEGRDAAEGSAVFAISDGEPALVPDGLALLRRPQGVRGNAYLVLHSFSGAVLKLEDVCSRVGHCLSLEF